ncbi:hypothetical protein KKB18_07775 [bacterium]|nr:hypothetical protein [bacterium]
MNTPKADQEKLPLDNKASEIKDTLKMNSSKLKILAATVLISLSLSQALNAQETKPINDPEHPVFNMESFSNCKNLTFVIDNVEKYFPGMEEDVKDMLATITTQERREAVDSILAQTVMILSDEKQKI